MADKKVDESWKQQVEFERKVEPAGSPLAPQAPLAPSAPLETPAKPPAPELPQSSESPEAQPDAAAEAGIPEARFDLFVTGLAVDALIALGDMANPATRKQQVNLDHARYLIDLLGLLEEKTRGNLSADEERLLKDTLYQLRMRYMAKTGG